MAFKEHNNRKKAKTLAEFITSEPLRRYMAEKVRQYVGNDISVFDGAAGSGQLEQFIKLNHLVAVEIQEESCKALKMNYPEAVIFNESFFTYESKENQCDCTVMNPPFSLKFKELSDKERESIQAEFQWKKSGVMDDIFILKGLKQAKRFGFFIIAVGVGTRSAEATFRKIIGNQLVELNRIENGFDDTAIPVMFLVIDKLKTTENVHRELFDCAKGTIVVSDEIKIESEWRTISAPLAPKEKIDPINLEGLSREALKLNVQCSLQLSKLNVLLGEMTEQDFDGFCDELCQMIEVEKFSNGGLSGSLLCMAGALKG
ncbi:N-6 DNA methylase [Gallibacterium anatis]|uniref:DNA methylase adenine-specific domain-containing protein n=1 Tax=Gallibacterium anatis TaxID=750 RepID=A0A0A2XI40_9PAST|nr:N-6 DNA methylase [Gallibacterium anatis]KGQ31833.1 hypothetical protein JP32_06205 [Gallibacterium anatis]